MTGADQGRADMGGGEDRADQDRVDQDRVAEPEQKSPEADGRGAWMAAVVLVVLTAMMSVIPSAILMFVPLALLYVALPPRHPFHIAMAAFIGWLALRIDPAAGTLWYFGRGWALILGAWFVLMVALFPGWRFLQRALAAVGATVVTAAIIMIVRRGGFEAIDLAVSGTLREGAHNLVVLIGQSAGSERVREEFANAIQLGVVWQARLFPAQLALASLSALGVAWWAFARLARGVARPLGRLREFRFRDELVWLLIIGMLLWLLPLNQPATRAGVNLVAFMGALYAVRGLAIFTAFGRLPGPLGIVVGALLLIFLYPFVMATTFLVGLSDTWLDIRSRGEVSPRSGS